MNCNLHLLYISIIAFLTPHISPLRLVFFTGLAIFKKSTKKQKFGTHLGPILERPQATFARAGPQEYKTLGARDPCPHNVHILGFLHQASTSLIPKAGHP